MKQKSATFIPWLSIAYYDADLALNAGYIIFYF